jgi:pyruvate decarboxylase
LDIPLPEGAVFVSQILWGSIGWTIGITFAFPFHSELMLTLSGSTLGAAFAAKDKQLGRTILFIGDGSM